MRHESHSEKRAAIYYRYSSDKDAQVENSQKRQEDRLKGFCQRKEWFVEWRGGDDSVSGDKVKPVLMELKRAVEAGEVLIDVLVVASWDRLTRRGLLSFGDDVKWLEENGIDLALVQDDKIYDLRNTQQHMELMFRVYEASSYLKSLSKNIRDGQAARFKRGELRYSNAPFGFDKDDKGGLVPNDDLHLVPKMFEATLGTGVAAAQTIMGQGQRYLGDSQKFPSASAARSVLRNTVYIGLRTFGVTGTGRHGTIKSRRVSNNNNVDRIAESELDPIDVKDMVGQTIPDELFESVQKVLNSNIKARPKRSNRKYKYSGLVRCSCGNKLTSEKRRSYISYSCPRSRNKKNGCDVEVLGRKSLNETEIGYFVGHLCNGVLRQMSFHKNVLARLVKYVEKEMVVKDNSGIERMREIERLKKRKASMWSMMSDLGDEDYDSAQEQIKNITAKIKGLESDITKRDVEIDQLLNGKFVESDIDGTGEYLNCMMELAKEIADADTKPKASAVNKRLKAIYGKLIRGKEFTPFYSLLEELQIKWAKVGNRCRPRRVEAIWKASLATTAFDTDSGDNLGDLATSYSGVLCITGIRIVFYPTSGRSYPVFSVVK